MVVITLFTPTNIGSIKLENRFIRSATFENMANPDGTISSDLIKFYERLADGGIGLIISGHMFVHPKGKGSPTQIGIHNDYMIDGLKELTNIVHQYNSKVVFQLSHAGRQTSKKNIGSTPLGPSHHGRDFVNFVNPKEMTESDIEDTIDSFVQAIKRAVKTNADGVQLHGAHGYLINQFLSPFFNKRTDKWGGSPEKRFRILKEIISRARNEVSKDYPLLIKLNAHDYTSKKGITPNLAVIYAKWLAQPPLSIDAIEVSCGTTYFSPFNSARGKVPVSELSSGLSWWIRPAAKFYLKRMVGKFPLEEPYNLEFAKMIKYAVKNTPVILVGGIRKVSDMKKIIETTNIDFLALSRPFIREPSLIQRIKANKTEEASCISCNNCIAALSHNLPMKCYVKGIPKT